ncbi:MAG: TonB-dependent receptor, partial [Candidatus Binatia bacterium]
MPVAVTGLSAEDLQSLGVRTITDLQQSVPGLQFGESGAKTPSIFIRGIGQREGNAVLDPGVGVYINDVFIPRQDAQLLDTVDTESIQVLRGPQGTLFGKNTTGGAILITTRRPDFEQYDGEVGVRPGSFGRRDLMLRGNAPLITGSMAARFALNVTKQAGFLENEVDGANFGDEDRISATTRLLWNPTDSLATEIFGYWSRQDERGTAITCIHQNPASNLSQVDWPARPDFEVGCRRSEEVSDRDEVSLNTGTSFTKMSTGILALTTDWTIGGFEVKSVTGLNSWWGIERNDDQDATAITILSTGTAGLNETLEKDGKPVEDEKRYQVSEELRLQSSAFADKLRYTVGAFGSIERVRDFPFTTLVGPNGLGGIRPSTVSGMAGIADLGPLDDTFRIPFPTLLGTRSDLDNDSAAFFAQASYDVTDWLQLTAGGRYTYEHRTRDLTTIDVDLNAYCPRVQGVPLATTGLCSPITLAQFDALGQNPPTLPLIINRSADVRSESWSEFTPSVTLSVNAPESWIEGRLDSLLTYFTYSTGFKAGGFEPRGDALVSFDPEKVTNFEVGFKTDLLDRRLRVNAAGYHLSYDDIQVRVAEQGPMITDIFLFLSNASKAQVTGGEMEATLLAGDDWLFHATAAYT